MVHVDFEQCELLSGGGCLENATTSLIRLFGAYKKRKIKKRWENQHKMRLELWIHDALVELRWVGWSSKMTAPAHKRNFPLFKCF